MKNLLLMTILVGTIACNGSGGGTPMVEVDPETKQLVQTREVWSHELEACEDIQETPTLRIECVNKGIKPLQSNWIATPNIEGIPVIEKRNGLWYRNGLDGYDDNFIDLENAEFEFVMGGFNNGNSAELLSEVRIFI